MFTSSLFEKGCSATSENSSSTRSVNVSSNSSPSNRFPVGIPSPGDDNQNVRIQLAVHKYNNSLPGSPSSSRRSLMSPLRHSFFKNPHKPRSYDGESDHLLNRQHHHYHQGSPRTENRYEGVGNFPTVHLKKSSVLYRPIRRLKEVKVPYPELPVNRFMNYTPEYCADAKSSPRSVLDVLQDMSRKKIHSKDESDYPRYTSRGLGGDLPVNEETLCRPLFVQKPKQSVISTRDNTTQTFSSQRSDRSSIASSASSTKIDMPDPRAELRRKLAKQNNEIFASLSSSLTSTFALKRKIDKISVVKGDRQGSDQSLTTVKKARLYDSSSSTSASSVGSKADGVVNGVKNVSGGATASTPVLRVTRNERLSEGGSTATSPSKDRLTTIYLDMESSTSPKAQIFQKSPVNEGNTGILNGSLSLKNAEKLNFNSTTTKTDTEHSFGKEASKGTAADSVLPVSSCAKVDNAVVSTVSTSSTITSFSTTPNSSIQEFKLNSTSPINFNFNGSTSSWAQSKSSNTFGQQLTTPSTVLGTSNTKTTTNANVSSENSSTTSKPSSQFGQFEVGQLTAGVSPPSSCFTLPGAGETKKVEPSSTTTFSIPTATTTATPQFAFGLNTITTTNTTTGTTKTTTTLPTFGGFSQSSSTTTTSVTNTNTSLFSFGQTSVASPATSTITPSINTTTINSTVSVSEKPEIPKNEFSLKFSPVPVSSGVTTSIGQSSQSSLFSFGQTPSAIKATDKLEKNQDTAQNKGLGFLTQPEKTEISQSLKSTFPVFGANSNASAPVSNSPAVSNNAGTPVTSTSQSDKTPGFTAGITGEKNSSVTSTSDSIKVPTMPFTFGQTSVSTTSTNPVGSTSGSEGNSSGQSSQLKGFTFGQPSSSQPSFTSTTSTTATTSAQLSFTSTGFNFGTTTTQANVFGQGLTKSSTELKPLFGQSSSQSSTDTLSQVPAFGQSSGPKEDKTKSTGVFGSIPGSSIFGQTVKPTSTAGNTFSGLTSIPPTSFGSSAATTAAGTTTPFGGTGFQTTATFGAPSTTQTTVSFGAPKTTQAPITFGAPSTNSANVAATSTTSASIFGTSTATQSAFSFGQSSTQVPTFGQSFNQNKTASSSLSTPSASIFGQNPTSTTGFATSTSNTFSTSGSQSLFGSKSESGEQNIFGQKSSTPAFGNSASSTQSFGSSNPLSFGLSSTNVQNGFQSSPPKSTDLPVFTFNAKPANSTSGSAFSFGSTGSATAGSTNSAPFSMNNANNPFQFGSATPKEGFNSATPSPAFTFGAQQNNNPLGNKASSSGTFNFGSNQGQPAGSNLNFGSTPSPSVFSFGSTGSASGSSTFNFGTPQPGGPFGQATPSPGFSVPGTFSIGSGSSSQSRPRASSRLRRRP